METVEDTVMSRGYILQRFKELDTRHLTMTTAVTLLEEQAKHTWLQAEKHFGRQNAIAFSTGVQTGRIGSKSLIDIIKAQLKATPQLAPPLEMCDYCFGKKYPLTSYYAEIKLPSVSASLFPSSEGVERRVLINFRLCDDCQRGIADVYANIPSLVGYDLPATAKIGECGGG